MAERSDWARAPIAYCILPAWGRQTPAVSHTRVLCGL